MGLLVCTPYHIASPGGVSANWSNSTGFTWDSGNQRWVSDGTLDTALSAIGSWASNYSPLAVAVTVTPDITSLGSSDLYIGIGINGYDEVWSDLVIPNAVAVANPGFTYTILMDLSALTIDISTLDVYVADETTALLPMVVDDNIVFADTAEQRAALSTVAPSGWYYSDGGLIGGGLGGERELDWITVPTSSDPSGTNPEYNLVWNGSSHFYTQWTTAGGLDEPSRSIESNDSFWLTYTGDVLVIYTYTELGTNNYDLELKLDGVTQTTHSSTNSGTFAITIPFSSTASPRQLTLQPSNGTGTPDFSARIDSIQLATVYQ